MDSGTLQDYLDDMIEERNKAIAEKNALIDYMVKLTNERDHWRRLSERALETLSDAIGALERIKLEASKAAGHD